MSKALISVSDKTNIVEICNFLHGKGVELISTGGTAKVLAENNIPYTPIEKITGNPEVFAGRMKTISFQIGSALLYRRDSEEDIEQAKSLNIPQIDYVICNLYPFKEVAQKTNELSTRIENIDIGGPTMIRAAAKNYKSVSVLTSPNQYEKFMQSFDSMNEQNRYKLALEAFKMTAEYDQYILNTLGEDDEVTIASTNKKTLRYGENPHQKAWMIPWNNTREIETLANAQILGGKELSYNNLIDADAGWKCTSDLNALFNDKCIVTIIKHANPCGVAMADNNVSAIEKAWECDPVSSFGSIISFNKPLTKDAALWLKDKFVEVIIAPEFESNALELLKTKKNLRLLKTPCKQDQSKEQIVKSINGALLVQEEDELNRYEYKPVTNTLIPKTKEDLKIFGMIVNKYVKSNSIALVGMKAGVFQLAGAGMGQPNRLDSLKMLAAPRAKVLDYKMEDLILISDAFFPFRDSIDVAQEVGVKNIIQPGGSIRDGEVISACNEFNIAMEFTGIRHFRH